MIRKLLLAGVSLLALIAPAHADDKLGAAYRNSANGQIYLKGDANYILGQPALCSGSQFVSGLDLTTGLPVCTTLPAVPGLGPNSVGNANLAVMPANTYKGAVSAGTPVDLTAPQATAGLNPCVGDAGSGGTKGLVPAPGAGDTTAGKFLAADCTFKAPPATTPAPPAPGVATTNTALQAMPTTSYYVVRRLGVATAYDAPPLDFIPSASACSLNSGNGDIGSQVKSADGKCWIGVFRTGDSSIQQWGAKCDWNGTSGTDDSGAFNKAVAWATARGGGTVYVPDGATCAISSTITVAANNVQIVGGAGTSEVHNTGVSVCNSNLRANTGFSGPYMINFYNGQGGASGQFMTGGGVRNLCMFGGSNAQYGIQVVSMRHGVFDNLHLQGFSLAALRVDVNARYNGGLVLGDPCDSQFNQFSNISINELSGGSYGIYLGGWNNASFPNGGCNTSLNKFENIDIAMNAQSGIGDIGGDNNTFVNVRVYTAGATGSGYSTPSVYFSKSTGGPGTPYAANSEVFYHFSANAGMALDAGSAGIQIFGLDAGNSSPVPSCVGTGSHANWFNTTSGTAGSC